MSWPIMPFKGLFSVPTKNGLTRPIRVRGTGHKMVNMGELFANDRIGADVHMDRVPMNERELDTMLVEPGDLLFARQSLVLSGAGKCSIVASVDEATTFESHLIRVRLDKNAASPDFYYYYFKSPSCGIRSIVTQGVQAGIRASDLGKLPVHLPPLKTQQGIAQILAAYDGLIENNRRRMALLEEAARQLYREWFVRRRFPGHEHTRITKGVPEGWSRMTLRTITTKIGSGSTPRGGETSYLSEGIPLIRSLNVYNDRFEDERLAFIGEEQASALDGVTVQSRDILLNITGASVTRCCMAPERHLPARVNQHVMIIRVDSSKADPFFVHAAINSDERKQQLLSYAQKGSTREALTKEAIAGFEVTQPTHELMRQFGEIAEASFLQRENLALQNQKLRAARDLLLPRFMSGEIAA